MTDARCIGIWGMRGMGKTSLMQELLGKAPAVIAYDALGEFSRKGWPAAKSIEEMHALIAPEWRRGFKVALVPTATPRYAVEADAMGCTVPQLVLHKLATWAWHAQLGFERGHHRRFLTLVVDEMNLGYPSRPLPAMVSSFETPLLLQGRHRGIEVIGASQAPALVGATYRRSCETTYVFALPHKDDRLLWRDQAREIEALPRFHYLKFQQGVPGAARGETRPGAAA